MQPFLTLLFVLLLAVDTASARFDPNVLHTIDSSVANAIREKRLPGGIVWIEREGQAWNKSYGYRATIPRRESTTQDTVYDIASLTKVVATTPSILILAEHGKINLQEPVATHIPAFTGNGREKVTLHHLLTHTSGLRPGISLRGQWQGVEAAIRLACNEKLQQAPGGRFTYSDINFILLGEIVHRVSGKPLDEFAKANIFTPLGMRETGFRPAPALRARIAPTTKVDGQMLRGTVHDPTARRMGGVAGHAGVFSTVTNLARFARMILGNGVLEGTRILTPESVRIMTTVQTPPGMTNKRGVGWDIHTGYSSPRGSLFPIGSFGHTGFTGPSLWIDPTSLSFWILMTNRNHPDGGGGVVPLRRRLGTLAAEAVADHRPQVLNGIDVLLRQDFESLKGLRVGLVTNHTGIDARRLSTIDLLHQNRRVQLRALFSPEHGIRGVEDDRVNDSIDKGTGLPVYSLYGKTKKPRPAQLAGLDALVFDIQDIGTRFYTYMATMGNCMEAAAAAGLKFIVLDRVNPVGGHEVNGPLLKDTTSFVRYHDIPVRHGMTAGELARMFNKEKGFNVELVIIPVQGWRRDKLQDATGLPWRNPSPNMRNLTQAILYPGVGLLEFCSLSVGRGTDTPFEVLGAPYIDDLLLAGVMNAKKLPGITFLPIRFTPDASKFSGQVCGGVNLVLTDRKAFKAVETGIQLAVVLHKLYPRKFDLKKVNTLLGHPKILADIRDGRPAREILQGWKDDEMRFRKRRREFLLYPGPGLELQDLLRLEILGFELQLFR